MPSGDKPAVDRVVTSGASLASLLHSVATAPSDFDGLLLGRVVRKTTAVTTDESEFGETESVEAFLSGFLCNGGVCSFYSPVGEIHEATVKKLQSSSGGSNILGWFVFRNGMHHGATMREARVCHQLHQLRNNTDMPVLFGVVSTCLDHGGATTTFQLRMYQQLKQQDKGSGSSQMVQQAVHMRVDNIGTSISHKVYDDVSHLCVIPQVPSFHSFRSLKEKQKAAASGQGSDAASESGAASDVGGGSSSKLHQLAVEGVYGQVQGIEELYKNILRKVDSLSREVGQSSADLCQQLQRVRQLESSLHQTQNKLRMAAN